MPRNRGKAPCFGHKSHIETGTFIYQEKSTSFFFL